MSTKSNYLFVYCDMKKNGKFHSTISSWCKFIGEASLPGFNLYSVNDTYPTIAEGQGIVYGEVYKIYNSTILNVLDMAKAPDKRKIFPIEIRKTNSLFSFMRKFQKTLDEIPFPTHAWVFHRSKWSIDYAICSKIKSGNW